MTLLIASASPVLAQTKSLYERIGGQAALKVVVDDFVALTAANPKVNFTRSGKWQASDAAVATLKGHLVDFLAGAFGGPENYKGRDMKTAHAGLKITQAEFDALAGDLKTTLEKHKVGKAEIAEIMKIAASTAPDIVEVR
jgi:hemoglobin